MNPTNPTPQYTSASLYVGDLHPDVSESFLYELFREAGPVLSIRVCRDAVTRKSLGYAYVNFQNPTDAERALDTLNYTVVKAKPMRIMWSHRDPSVRKSGIGNIFIKNLDKSIDNKILYDTFSIFGNILSCKVATERIRVGTPEEKIVSKGYGFVHYETQEAAEQAIAKVNNMELCDKIVYVGPFIRRAERIKQSGENQFFTNVYIKNLPDSFDTTKLTELFAPFGTITKAVVVTDENGKSRQFGFANFAKPEEAKKAVEALNNTAIDGKTIYVGRAQKKQERQAMLKAKHEMLREERVNKYKGLNLYVRNLDETVDDAKLAEEFSQYGKINSATVMKNDKKISKGFGFVCFSTAEEATRAIKETNGKMFFGKPLYVALAQRKEERRAWLEAQYSQRITSMRPGVQPSIPGPVMYTSPVFYGQPGINIQQRPGFYPQQMVRQRGWLPTQPGQARNSFPMGGYVQHPHNVQRAPRPRGGRGQSPNPQQPNKSQQTQPPQQAGAQGNRRGFKYNNTARNRPDQTIANPAIAGQQMAPQMVAQPAMIAQEPLNPSFLAQASPEMRKQMLGERLYPLIEQQQPENAAKITGMLLDAMDFGELLHLIESPAALAEKIQEALGVLIKAATEGDAAPLE